MSHARALDLGLRHAATRYVLCMHTDTLVYDGQFVDLLFAGMRGDNVVGVGPVDQRHRSTCRRLIRVLKKTAQHYLTRRQTASLNSGCAPGISFHDRYIKSYSSLWDADVLKATGVQFGMNGMHPGYGMQDTLERGSGYRLARLPTAPLFRCIEHLQSGTLVEMGSYGPNHRRSKAYRRSIPSRVTACD